MGKKLALLWLTAALCVVPALGASPAEEPWEPPGLRELWRQTEDLGVDREQSLERGLLGLLVRGAEQLDGLLRGSLTTGGRLLAVVLLCGLAEGVRGPGGGPPAVELAGALAITALTMTDVDAMLGLGRETIGRMDLFAGSLLPVMAALTAASGGVTAAAARQGATVLFSQLLLAAMDKLVAPLLYGYVAVSCACAAVGAPGLSRLAALLKGAATGLLTGILLVFVGYLTASGAVAGSVDASAVKAARLAISRAVPVVGGVLADASETVLAGASALRGTVGAAGLLAVLAICLTPFLQLALHYLVYRGTAALCAAVAQPRLSQLVDAIGGAFGVVLGMTGAAALVLLVSLVSALSAAAP